MTDRNVEIVRRSMQAFNERDVDGFLALGTADSEWMIAEENPTARTLWGHEEIAAYLHDWFETMPGLRFDADEHISAGDAVVTIGTVSRPASETGPEISVSLAFITRFSADGLVARTEEYLDPDKALAAAGIE